MDQVVELERIDLPGVQAPDAFTYVIYQLGELGFVVLADHLARGTTLGLARTGLSRLRSR